MRRSNGAFTLIEILVVLAIIGILAAITIPMFLRSRDIARLREVQAQVARDIEKAKFLARRHSYKYISSFNTTTGIYSFTPSAISGSVSSEAITITNSLPGDTKFLNSPTGVTFSAPFGRIDAAPTTPPWIKIGFKRTVTPEVAIDVVGVTGIVVKRDVK